MKEEDSAVFEDFGNENVLVHYGEELRDSKWPEPFKKFVLEEKKPFPWQTDNKCKATRIRKQNVIEIMMKGCSLAKI